ncbi:MAG TPA: uroporphyrinogen-III synthase [Spongiibacteraceae bacterium]
MAAKHDMPFAALRVLVTRPQDRADDLIAAIADRGGSAVHIPLLTVMPLDEQRDAAIWQQTRQRILDLDRYRRVIAISVNAVHYGLAWIDNYWPQLPQGIAWHGIGAATIAALAQRDIIAQSHADGTAAMSSEALLTLPALQRPGGERVLILRGIGGRETLAAALRERGAQVDYAECYRRVEPVINDEQLMQLQRMAFDVICVNSNETLQNLWRYLQPAAQVLAQNRALIVPSERVSETARELGFARIIVAINAGTAATIDALMKVEKSKL